MIAEASRMKIGKVFWIFYLNFQNFYRILQKNFQKQARRVYEILRLIVTPQNDDKMMSGFISDVKRRLNLPFQVSNLIDCSVRLA